MRGFLAILSLFCVFIFACCATASHSTNSDKPIVNIKKTNLENTTYFSTPGVIREFIQTTPEYAESVLLANEFLGDEEIRRRLEYYGYSPYVSTDLNKDGKDEYAFVILNQKIPTLLIIKKTIEGEWKEEFSIRLNSYAQIKLSEPSVGIFGGPCVIVANISMKAIYNICWDGMKYLVVEF